MFLKKTKLKTKKNYSKTKKNRQYVNAKQKGGEEKMSNLDPEIEKRQKEKKKKQLLIQTLIKLIMEKNLKKKGKTNIIRK